MIIIEGPQGTGKTTLANFLRENIPSSNLYRLSGQKDKTITGKSLSEKMYITLLEYLKQMESIPMDMIFDRTFFTEEVYSRLGYKEYDFHDVYESLLKRLESLHYEVYLFLLYLEDVNLFSKRLDRGTHHNYQSFSLSNSAAQQEVYLQIGEELKDSSFHVIPLKMDDFSESYEKVNQLLLKK